MDLKRSKNLNDKAFSDGRCVIYVMSRDQRVHDNHALLEAQKKSKQLRLPLIIWFNFLTRTGVRSKEHYEYMVSGLKEVQKSLSAYNINMHISYCNSADTLSEEIDAIDPAFVVFDFSPLKGSIKFKNIIAKKLSCKCVVVDTHNIIPVWEASDKEEFAANTFRFKVNKKLQTWLKTPDKIINQKHNISVPEINWQKIDKLCQSVKPSGISIQNKSGEEAALNHLKQFIKQGLKEYAESRNNPNIDGQSNLSSYLHFGQISSLRVALELTKNHEPLLFREAKLAKYEGKPTVDDSIDAFLEEMVVRKELADNYCYYNSKYKTYQGLRDWAKNSLSEHFKDKREYVYDLEDLEQLNTHDDAWNAAQAQLEKTGKMHGYMRMYWAKKILEWSKSPEVAIIHANYLNDHYSVDGGDPNGYVGVLWSIGGLHDRPWFDRPVYGKIRYMNINGLKSKFDVDSYIKQWLK